jgi:hypothetical protein
MLVVKFGVSPHFKQLGDTGCWRLSSSMGRSFRDRSSSALDYPDSQLCTSGQTALGLFKFNYNYFTLKAYLRSARPRAGLFVEFANRRVSSDRFGYSPVLVFYRRYHVPTSESHPEPSCEVRHVIQPDQPGAMFSGN